MDKLLVRKDVYEELLEKGFGKKDLSKLTKKKITDKNGHTRTVYVRNGEQPAEVKRPKAQEGLTPEKKARYEEMLEKVKAGSDENALFVGSKGMLNKKDAIAYLSAKLGKKVVSSAAQGHLESDTPQNTDITKEDEERFGKQALSGLSGKRTSSEEKKSDNKDNTKIENHADLLEQAEKIYVQAESDAMDSNLSREDRLKARDKEQDSYKLRELLEFGVDKNGVAKNEETATKIKELIQNLGLKDKPTQDDMKSESTSIFDEEMEGEGTTAKTFEDAVKNYNFTDEKKNQFAMDEVAKFYPDLKETVDKHRKAFRDVDDAKKKLDVNPNNKEYQENFKNAANELSKMNKEYETKAAKALEKAPNIPKPSFEKYMDARRTVDKFKDTYKKQLEEYEIGQKFRNSNAAAILDPMYGLKPNDYTKDSGFINAQMTIRAYEGK